MTTTDPTAKLEGYPVQLAQEVVWGDMDAFQHVNNTVYFRYFEDIRLKFMTQTGVMDILNQTKVGPILASTSCDFRAPLTYPDTIHIGARVSNIQERKISMEYLVVSEKLNKIVAEGTGLMVYYDYDAGKTCAVPEVISAAIQKL
jgi:acyl-CoA thioester hydrolase